MWTKTFQTIRHQYSKGTTIWLTLLKKEITLLMNQSKSREIKMSFYFQIKCLKSNLIKSSQILLHNAIKIRFLVLSTKCNPFVINKIWLFRNPGMVKNNKLWPTNNRLTVKFNKLTKSKHLMKSIRQPWQICKPICIKINNFYKHQPIYPLLNIIKTNSFKRKSLLININKRKLKI